MNFLFILNFIYTVENVKKLSKDIVPSNYNLHFTISPEKFEGFTTITVKTNKNTKNIILNAKDLEIQSIAVEDEMGIILGSFTCKDEIIDISLEDQLLKNKEYKISIKYQGKYSMEMDGIYKSSYNGKPIYSTQFEPTFARKAFPCFDQPDLKATFTIQITAPENHTVLSNSSLDKKEDKSFYFNTTKPMSTYLVAFAVGQLEYLQTTTLSNIPIRLYADKLDIKNGDLALEVAKHTLDFFQNYFKIEYPFPKLDLIAIPEYAMGAMENWGLVTFRKTSLLFNPKTDATTSKLNVIETVCHELAHMWFGNLVTMNWWNDLWLNEGFATWASFMAVNNLPNSVFNFDIWTNFINTTLEEGMDHDSLNSTHPIAVKVHDPNEINQIFDKISYNKGASLIRMIETYIGHESFRKGIQRYMNYFKYSNSESTDFFSFQNNPTLTTKMAFSWLNQKGFPLITVKENNKELIISQKRFFSGYKDYENQLWTIPITIKFKNNSPETFIFDTSTIRIPLKSDIYKINISNVGFYRVLYDKITYKKIFTNFNGVKDRLNIINDLFALAFANYIDISWVIQFLTDSSVNYDYELLKSVLIGLRKLCTIFYDDKDQLYKLKKIISRFIDPYVNDIELEKNNEDISAKLLNSLIVTNAIFVGNEQIMNKLKDLYDDFKEGEKQICPDYIYPMLVSVVEDCLDDVINIAKNSLLSNMRIMAMKALGTVKNLDNMQKVLNLYKELDRQDISYYFSGLGSNTKHKNLIIDFFIKNYDKISKYIINQGIINSSMAHVLGGISTPELIKLITDFLLKFKDNMTVNNILEINQIYKEFRKKNSKLIIKF